MATFDRALFLSLRPAYAGMILNGDKTVELRRIRPRAAMGSIAVIYATSPICAVLGLCRVGEVTDGEPDEIWDLHGHVAGIDRPQFDAYFAGAETAVAITVTGPLRLKRPVPLAELRLSWLGFQPPQSFRYISRHDLDAIAPDAATAYGVVAPWTAPLFRQALDASILPSVRLQPTSDWTGAHPSPTEAGRRPPEALGRMSAWHCNQPTQT